MCGFTWKSRANVKNKMKYKSRIPLLWHATVWFSAGMNFALFLTGDAILILPTVACAVVAIANRPRSCADNGKADE
jgi:hypothetical protein